MSIAVMAIFAERLPSLMRMLITVIVGLCLGYLCLVIFVYVRQSKMLYFPTKTMDQTPVSIGLTFNDIALKTTDGLTITAWYIPAPDAKAVILFCHGNAGNISDRLDSIKIFHDLGLGVLIFDYRGYGRSEGEPTEQGTYLDAEAAWNYLITEKGVAPGRIIIFGRSLGSAVAAELATRTRAGALIIESGFTSIPDLGRKYYPYLPVSLITRFHYATIDKVNSLTLPMLIIHSPEDEVIPYEQGMRIFEKAGGPKDFLKLRGSHNEGFHLSGKVYINGLDQFISKYF